MVRVDFGAVMVCSHFSVVMMALVLWCDLGDCVICRRVRLKVSYQLLQARNVDREDYEQVDADGEENHYHHEDEERVELHRQLLKLLEATSFIEPSCRTANDIEQ